MTLPEPITVAVGVIVVVLDIAIRVAALIFVPRNRRPQTALKLALPSETDVN